VTVPNKEAAFAAVDRRDEAATAVGAVNTIWHEDGHLAGGNSDVYGFLAHLDASASGWRGMVKRAVVLGAGGAARAVVYALTNARISVTVVNRTRERADKLASDFAPRAHVHEGVGDALADADLLVNTTTLGMTGKPALTIDLARLPRHALVYDLVYVPLETPLLRTARARGNPVVDGLGMLLHQAAPGFARWFGVMPPVTDELRALVAADIRAKS
jgi:shikimate dehydrogenase